MPSGPSLQAAQDWEPTVWHKAGPTGRAARGTAVVNAARRAGDEVDTAKRVPNAKKLDENTEAFRHEGVSHDFKMALQQARLAKKLTQAALAAAVNEKPSVINDYESGKAAEGEVSPPLWLPGRRPPLVRARRAGGHGRTPLPKRGKRVVPRRSRFGVTGRAGRRPWLSARSPGVCAAPKRLPGKLRTAGGWARRPVYSSAAVRSSVPAGSRRPSGHRRRRRCCLGVAASRRSLGQHVLSSKRNTTSPR
ncbi:unnamed protein product [Prorocentrum cordatum]|uniref:HTH cro/C1-type domain-containing protein n=1 Tax=Prorocentrum cordatum TaxID=2364126 RepID=A0ABN9S132_9DINO|nr:unnamed protein product [Polarella glacialis]